MRFVHTLALVGLLVSWPLPGVATPSALASRHADVVMADSMPDVRVYVGMWSLHFLHLGRGFNKNILVAVAWGDLFGGTFINSYGDRAFAAGFQKTLARGANSALTPSVGYRLGVVSGYDGRFMRLASKTPVIPMVQLLGGFERGRVGFEMGWSGIVGSLAPSFRF